MLTLTPRQTTIIVETGCHVEDSARLEEIMLSLSVALPLDMLTAQQFSYLAQRVYRRLQVERDQEVT